MSKYPEALLETVARGIFTGILYGGDDAEWEAELADESQYSRKALLLCAAQDALDALGMRVDELWTPVGVNGDRWGQRRRAEAEQVARDYPRDWTYMGEENLGPNGIDHLEGERRLVFESEWEPIRD